MYVIYLYINMYIYICICIYVHLSMHYVLNIHMIICVYLCVYLRRHEYVHIYAYVNANAYVKFCLNTCFVSMGLPPAQPMCFISDVSHINHSLSCHTSDTLLSGQLRRTVDIVCLCVTRQPLASFFL